MLTVGDFLGAVKIHKLEQKRFSILPEKAWGNKFSKNDHPQSTKGTPTKNSNVLSQVRNSVRRMYYTCLSHLL